MRGLTHFGLLVVIALPAFGNDEVLPEGTIKHGTLANAQLIADVIYLTDAKEAKTLLKVAQPRSWLVEEGRVVIDEAAYVQWAGKRLARAEGFPAVAITSVSSGAA